MEYKIISTDDHLVEPPDVWTKRVPAAIKDKVPHIRDINGTPKWFVEDTQIAGVNSNAGVAHQDFGKDGVSDSYENMRPGGYDPKARLAELDQDGVDASILFPNFGRFHGNPLESVPDLGIRLECIKAYNDWIVDEFCAADPERLIPLALIPPWDIELAKAESIRCAKKGHKGLVHGMAPDIFGYPGSWEHYWNPFWATAQDLDVPVVFHQISATMDRAIFQKGAGVLGGVGQMHGSHRGAKIPGSMRAANIVAHVSSLINPLAELLMGGVLERFPKMKVVLAEGGVSWLPYVLNQADYVGERQKYTDGSWELTMLPSDYWKRQCASGFWSDLISPNLLEDVGEHTVMWEGDYPHGILTWPDSKTIIEQSMRRVTDEGQRHKILAANAMRMFNLG